MMSRDRCWVWTGRNYKRRLLREVFTECIISHVMEYVVTVNITIKLVFDGQPLHLSWLFVFLETQPQMHASNSIRPASRG